MASLLRPPQPRLLLCVCVRWATSFLICSPMLFARILALSRILMATNRPVSVSVANLTLRTVSQTERRAAVSLAHAPPALSPSHTFSL